MRLCTFVLKKNSPSSAQALRYKVAELNDIFVYIFKTNCRLFILVHIVYGLNFSICHWLLNKKISVLSYFTFVYKMCIYRRITTFRVTTIYNNYVSDLYDSSIISQCNFFPDYKKPCKYNYSIEFALVSVRRISFIEIYK